jgi:transcriptional regulator with XRE-family HTH domain
MRFDFESFYRAVNAKRAERAASWRQVAREIGVGKSTLARMAQNKRPDADGLAALSYWAEVNPADFVFAEEYMAAAPALHRNGESADCSAAAGSALVR